MSDPIWGEFESLGEVEVRKMLSMGRWGDQRAKMARAWIDHKESLRNSSLGEAALEESKSANALAREANSLAASANSLASRALRRAKTNNIIAALAAIIAAVALAVSIFKK